MTQRDAAPARLVASHLRDFAEFLPVEKREDFNATIDDLIDRLATAYEANTALDRALRSDTAPMKEALEYIAKGYSGPVGNCEGHSGTHCAEVALAALKKAAPQEPKVGLASTDSPADIRTPAESAPNDTAPLSPKSENSRDNAPMVQQTIHEKSNTTSAGCVSVPMEVVRRELWAKPAIWVETTNDRLEDIENRIRAAAPVAADTKCAKRREESWPCSTCGAVEPSQCER